MSILLALMVCCVMHPTGTFAQAADRQSLADHLQRLEQRIAELEQARAAFADSVRVISKDRDDMARRISELEKQKVAQEDAIRIIIAEAIASSGSKINDVTTFGGTFEYMIGWTNDFEGGTERFSLLNTVEIEFEIQASDWLLGNLVFEYLDGSSTIFRTTKDPVTSVDRVNVDTAVFTIGNVEKFFPYGTAGRMVLPFGISTGDPVADVLTIEDPLTIEIFEMRQDALFLGVAFPTPARKPQTPMKSPPTVQPQILSPAVGWLSRVLGYHPVAKPLPPQTYEFARTPPPPISLGVYLFSGDTVAEKPRAGWRPYEHFGATAGYRTFGPWSFEVDLDYNSSVFDSEFLVLEYRDFLDQIGLVSGMAGSIKAKLGRVPMIVEWNGALEDANFTDDAGQRISMRPSAWQVSVGYQFDWNPWMEVTGGQGTYLALTYSQSRDLVGVTNKIAGELERVGSVPEQSLLVHVGEWIWDSTRVAIEYSRIVDYSKQDGGTGKSASAWFSTLTYEW